jgi:hypothetical protein
MQCPPQVFTTPLAPATPPPILAVVITPPPPAVPPIVILRNNIILSDGVSVTMADLKATFTNQVTVVEVVRVEDNAFVKFHGSFGNIDENWKDKVNRFKDEPPFDDSWKWEAVGGEITLNVMGW